MESANTIDISIDVEVDSDKNTFLMYELRKGYNHIATHLLKMGADHKLTDKDGNTILMLTLSYYASDVMRTLVRLHDKLFPNFRVN
ncbi:hypothetical protein BG74_01615 [Sodalis-like endosymbiont of Proechinophthirus fluctus]|uniref:ankyrin repeat domain-containing protein n=1 Tax=Sodalis-like endosymbiont of Proechinophthirus fluctus TaxID=1462730 RepID=UPI0007A8712B|nr:ankyrin repeat domain-containing protein [Sodalis-like endosymbiont of Proechinophthirus fluctus]KYP97647.1 hypothetical protein BG74_01615 [Sodalis-like endosymbiont of Proechinophthirus fluctus]